MTKVCVYHNADLDGHCSCAIWAVAHADEPHTLVGMNYGDDIDWGMFDGADVAMLDFSFEPWDNMVKLAEMTNNLLWIDHHVSAIKNYMCNGLPGNVEAVLGTSLAACELTWHRFFSESTPSAVWLLGRYDVYDFDGPFAKYKDRILDFQYGARSYRTDIGAGGSIKLWREWFDTLVLDDVIARGKVIREYQQLIDERCAESMQMVVIYEANKWLAFNKGRVNSGEYLDAAAKAGCVGVISFVAVNNKWKIGLYSNEVDCSEIAHKYDGGGHKGAAGFVCANLPFNIGGV